MMRRVVACLSLGLLAACASERVILLPAAEGRASALVVKSAQGERPLDRPYAAIVREGGRDQPYQSSAQDVQQRFAPALAAQPQRAQRFILYFQEGSDSLVAEAEEQLKRVLEEIKRRSAAEVLVTGHTDRVGSVKANDALSLKRAAAVREVLLAVGVPEKLIEMAGRGEREPLIPTDDEIAEPRNRRVEINVQ